MKVCIPLKEAALARTAFESQTTAARAIYRFSHAGKGAFAGASSDSPRPSALPPSAPGKGGRLQAISGRPEGQCSQASEGLQLHRRRPCDVSNSGCCESSVVLLKSPCRRLSELALVFHQASDLHEYWVLIPSAQPSCRARNVPGPVSGRVISGFASSELGCDVVGASRDTGSRCTPRQLRPRARLRASTSSSGAVSGRLMLAQSFRKALRALPQGSSSGLLSARPPELSSSCIASKSTDTGSIMPSGSAAVLSRQASSPQSKMGASQV